MILGLNPKQIMQLKSNLMARPQELSLGFETLQAFMAPASCPAAKCGGNVKNNICGWAFTIFHPIYSTKVAQSFNKLLDGVQLRRHMGSKSKHRVFRAMVCNFMGDWKWHKDPFPEN